MGSERKENAFWYIDGQALASGNNIQSPILDVMGARDIVGRITRATTSYDVDVEWLDPEGNVIFTESIASAVGGGTDTDLDDASNYVPVRSRYARVVISDAGAGAGAVTATIHAR